MVEHTATDVLKFTKEVSNALLKVRPLGGSELFVKRFGDYFADPVYCGEMIEDTHRRLHAAHLSRVKAERELEVASARIAALEGALASRLDLAEELREYTAMKYAGDCKCGKCQLVPRELIDRLRAALASTEAMKGE